MPSTFKIIGYIGSVLIIVTLLALRQPETPAARIRQQLVRQTDSLLLAIQQLQRKPSQRQFRNVRVAYKRIEWAAEYFDPLDTRLVNGPPVPEAEQNGLAIEPDGLQVIETTLFPQFSVDKHQQLDSLTRNLADHAAEIKSTFEKADLQDWQVLDALKQEAFRIEVLGLNDFDDPLLKNCFKESAAALQSVQQALSAYKEKMNFSDAISCLEGADDFNRFDRAAFIRRYGNPMTRAIKTIHDNLHLPDIRYNRLLNQDAATLFDKDAFNRNAFIDAPEDSATDKKIALGKKLFFDPVLSGNGKRSCASCHQPDKAFTDGLVKNLDVSGKKMIARNTPTLINAALQPAQFYDLRAASLEDQARDVMQNKTEMHGDMQIAITKLWRDNNYKRLFEAAYPQRARVAIDTFEVMNALASYVRSLTALNSRFDRYMRGLNSAMKPGEIAGFNLFMGKAKCSTCHYLPLFNGALPPRYMQMEAEVIGVPKHKSGGRIDPDPGTYGIQPLYFNRHAFKVTTVRNTGRTAPYMHNGIFKSLAEVIDFYDKGGGAGMGLHLTNQTLDAAPLKLTTKEKAQLVAFIKTLNNL